VCNRPLTSDITICVQNQVFLILFWTALEVSNESTRGQLRKLSERATVRRLQINTSLFRYSRRFTAVTVSARNRGVGSDAIVQSYLSSNLRDS